MSDSYQNIAAVYNRLFSTSLKQLREDIRTYIFHRKFKKIIDICCGTGEQLTSLERPDMQLSGLDNSPAMLEQARQYCGPGTELHFLDASKNVFSKGSFECAVISLSLHEKRPAEIQLIFENARNLVQEKGVIIIADYSPSPSSLWGKVIGKLIIPVIEKCAGSEHYNNYIKWMQTGGLEGFLSQQNQQADIISRPLHGTLLCCAVEKLDLTIQTRQSFGLLDYCLPQKAHNPGKRFHGNIR